MVSRPRSRDSTTIDKWLENDGNNGPGACFEFDAPVVFFARHTIPVLDCDGAATVELFRVGELEQEVRVAWLTHDGTAIGGRHFVPAQG
eukprot:CAMPEP_0198551314 /NCGR_PEP_ID=MMETSP1462-20131121/76476_1 /TAXON_ID=1333877 /ORGANISM="Brandtodinium nutriculum, Strain RCC3387" /LENGTH=88 /DNA_ID=CAMNT_0044281949 /DNA_START=29 /DNA_END=291 /DNA_ORIENTATION=+